MCRAIPKPLTQENCHKQNGQTLQQLISCVDITGDALLGWFRNVRIDQALDVDLSGWQGQIRSCGVVDVVGHLALGFFAARGVFVLLRTGRVGFDHHRVGLMQQGKVCQMVKRED